MTTPLEDFIAHFQSLTEAQQFVLGAQFNAATGGKLSPYNSPNPVAVGLVVVETEDGPRLLGVRRAIAPCIGEVALPGGYVNPGEDPVDSAVREVLEETGLASEASNYVLQGLPRAGGHNTTVMFFHNTRPIDEAEFARLCDQREAVCDGESSEFVLIDADTPLAFPLHQQAAAEFFSPTLVLSAGCLAGPRLSGA